MIILDVVQGTTEWLDARMGIPTASEFGRILTAKTRKPSSSATKYACELLAERLLGRTMDDATSDFMQRGSALENEAVAAYEFDQECATEKVGFVLDDTRQWGCSPDRFVGEDGLLEVKCVSASNHIAALLGLLDDDHVSQIQGQMMVTGRRWCDLWFYNPMLPAHRIRIYRDEEHVGQLHEAVQAFCYRVNTMHAQLLGDSPAMAAGTDGMEPVAGLSLVKP